jgi:hypothetical protein
MALGIIQHITKPGCWVMFLGGGLANDIGGNVTIKTEVNSQKKLKIEALLNPNFH